MARANTLGLELRSLEGVADSGTPATASLASANPGQTIRLLGVGFDATTDVVFPILDGNGASYQRVIRPLAVAADGTSLEVVVPVDAVTGPVGIVGDTLGNQPWLQIVPVVTNGDFRSIAADRSTASVRLQGLGFIEGNETTYTFGEVSVIDRSLTGGPNSGWFFTHDNDGVDLTLPTGGDNFHGAVTVTTAGGTSAPWSVGFTELVSTAMNGTPADGNEASANAGQVVNILGTGLHAGTDILGRYVDSNGTNITQLLNPFYAKRGRHDGILCVANGLQRRL